MPLLSQNVEPRAIWNSHPKVLLHWNFSLGSVTRAGLQQTASYMDLCGTESGHLVVFDMRPEKTGKERIFRRAPELDHTLVTVWGM